MLLHHEFIASARRVPHKLAFIDRAASIRLTYRRALSATLALAPRLRRLPDHRLGIMLPNSVACAVSILATLMAGKVPVMINYASGAEQNMRYAKAKCNFKTVITAQALLKRLRCEASADMILVEEVMRTLSITERLAAMVRTTLPLAWLLATVHGGDSDDTMLILFTSGSEREPKAVELSHRNIGSNVRAISQVFDIHDNDVFLAVLPWFHVFGQTAGLWLPLSLGLTLITHNNPLEFKTVNRFIREERPTVMVVTPYFLMGYSRQSVAGDFASLRAVVAGADKMPPWLAEAFQAKHGIPILEGYGATETSPVISVNLPDAHKPGSVGRPLPGVDVRIIDIDSGEPLPPGQEGKIQVRGDLVMKGYLGEASEVAAHIVGGWYDTGDTGTIDSDGYLWHRGRIKRFAKIGGEMISLARLERELEHILPTQVECCAVALPDDKRGSRITVALTGTVDERDTLQKLAERLPALALPGRFLVLDELPKMPSGKIDFRRTEELVKLHS
jgi:acyl-[acyl-carrier-protein]-phospholipid O-acyltransferase / long-chain-fatty-acid--[acyl-carrier-protein] ligase